MAFLLPAVAGAVASWGLNKLDGGDKNTDKKGNYTWDAVQTPEQKAKYSQLMNFMMKQSMSDEWLNMQRGAKPPQSSYLAGNILPGQFLGRQFMPPAGMLPGGGGGAGMPTRAGAGPIGGPGGVSPFRPRPMGPPGLGMGPRGALQA